METSEMTVDGLFQSEPPCNVWRRAPARPALILRDLAAFHLCDAQSLSYRIAAQPLGVVMLERRFTLAGCSLVPIVQGKMGVGISAHRLADAMVHRGSVGTIASTDLRHHHADPVAVTEKSRDKDTINATNLVALDRNIRATRKASQDNGMVAMNVMKAVESHPALVRQVCESGADAIVTSADLLLDLPEMTVKHSKVALIPILSGLHGVSVVLRR